MHRAFNEWSTVSSVDFREIPPDLVTKQPPDIYIAFEKGEHSDGFPFDGQGNFSLIDDRKNALENLFHV